MSQKNKRRPVDIYTLNAIYSAGFNKQTWRLFVVDGWYELTEEAYWMYYLENYTKRTKPLDFNAITK